MPRKSKALFIDTSGVKGLSGVQTGNTAVTTRAPQQKKRKPQLKGKLARGVRQMINKDKETHEIRFTGDAVLKSDVAVSSGFYALELNNVLSGIQANQRDGQSIYACGLKSSIHLFNRSIASPRSVQILLIRDNNKVGNYLNTTTWDGFYRNIGASSRNPDGIVGDSVAMFNKGYYRIIKQMTVILGAGDTVQGLNMTRIDIPLKEHMKFNYADPTDTTPRDGRLILVIHVVDPDGTKLVDGVKMEHFTRMFYKEA